MYARLIVLALAVAVCRALPQHHASSYSTLTRSSHGHHEGAGREPKHYAVLKNYGHHTYAAPVLTNIAAVAPIANVMAPVITMGKKIPQPVEYYAHPKYQFQYAVEDKHTGDVKSHHEERDGDHTRGYYTVHEPDGTILTVHYTVDKDSGFQAVVERKGHAAHPETMKRIVMATPVVHHAPVMHHAPVLHHATMMLH